MAEAAEAAELAIAGYLAGHPRVAAVHYPGIDKSTSELAGRQMPAGFGPLLSFELSTNTAQAADQVVESSRPDPADDQLRRRGFDLGAACQVGVRNRAGQPDPAVGRRGTAADLITDIDDALTTLEVP